jgi:subtilisin-like proprotein convertase family protein
MCETLFFGVVGDSDDYRRFKKAYNESLSFASIPQGIVAGEGVLAVEVLRHCPGDVTPGVEVSSKYNGIAGAHLGFYDPLFGGFGYYVPLIYAEKAGLNTVMYIQNGGLECSSVEIWFKAQDDCLRARICEIFTLAPGETYQWDASDCVGPDWQGSAWLRSSQELGIAVDIFGRDILMTYNAEPAPYDYVVGFDEETGDPIFERTPTTGERVAYGPLVYSEFQGWDTGIQVQNLSQILNAKVKVYFLDRSGDVITTLVDWICPRGSQTFFLPVVAGLPGNWVGSVRIESQDWWAPGTNPVDAPYVVGVATLMKYSDVARTATEEAIAYNLLPEHKSYVWQVGYGPGGRYSGVALIAIPSLLKDLDGTGTTSELAIMNLVAKPGFTDFAIYIYDQNGLVDFVCQKLHDRQVEYIDMQAWGYVNNGFKGSAIISATFWEHEVFDGGGHFIRNLVGLGAVSVERTGTRLGEDVPGDEAAGSRGIPLAQDSRLAVCRGGYLPACPGQPAASPVDGDCGPIQATGAGGAIPDSGGGIFVSSVSPSFVGDCAVRDVNLSLDISHTFVGDLNVSLLHGGTSSSLFNAVCGADDNIDVTLDDDNPEGRGNIGNAASCAGVGPVGGGNTYASQSGSALDAFNGQSAAGDWTLQIVDTFGGDTGTVNTWSLEVDTRRR